MLVIRRNLYTTLKMIRGTNVHRCVAVYSFQIPLMYYFGKKYIRFARIGVFFFFSCRLSPPTFFLLTEFELQMVKFERLTVKGINVVLCRGI